MVCKLSSLDYMEAVAFRNNTNSFVICPMYPLSIATGIEWVLKIIGGNLAAHRIRRTYRNNF